MLTYSTYSEAGGVGKTTTAANLAVAHARAGLQPLVIPLDPQEGNLSHLFGVDDQRRENVDTLAHHMIRRPQGEFHDLIRTVEHGIDIVPEHNVYGELDDWLRREQEQAEAVGEAFNITTALLRALKENNIDEHYDVLICDPPATEGVHLHNAITATRNLVIPIEPSAKGRAAIVGLEELVDGLETNLDIEVGVYAAIPVRYGDTADQRDMLDEIGYETPEIIRERASLMEGAWRQQCSAFTFLQVHRDRQRDYEVETLAKFDQLARHLEEQAGIQAPNPPNPGDLDHATSECPECDVRHAAWDQLGTMSANDGQSAGIVEARKCMICGQITHGDHQ